MALKELIDADKISADPFFQHHQRPLFVVIGVSRSYSLC